MRRALRMKMVAVYNVTQREREHAPLRGRFRKQDVIRVTGRENDPHSCSFVNESDPSVIAFAKYAVAMLQATERIKGT